MIVELQGLPDDARQVIVALMSAEIMDAASIKTDPLRPCFVVYEEGHNFAPAGGQAFFVDVPEQLNRPSVIFAGKLIARVGLAANKPAEFVVLRISRDTRALEAELAAAGA